MAAALLRGRAASVCRALRSPVTGSSDAACSRPAFRTFASGAAAGEAGATAQQTASSQPVPVKSRLSAFLLFLPSLGASGLMFWQLQRYQWKTEQIDERTEQVHRPPLGIAELHKLMPATQKLQHRVDRNTSPYWRQVRITGELKTDKAQYVGPRMRAVNGKSKQGYLMIVPMVPKDGSAPVLVNKGWVPTEEKVKASGKPVCIDVLGVVKPSETPASFLPEQGDGKWYWVDVPRIAEYMGLPRTTPLLEVVSTQPKQATATDEDLKDYLEFKLAPSHHLEYAATWFALSAATGLIARGAVKRQWARQSRR